MSKPISKETDTTKMKYKNTPHDNNPGQGDKAYVPVNPKQQLLHISKLLLESSAGRYNELEMEVKFGTRGIRQITKIDYDNVVKRLASLNFASASTNGIYSLKIQPEFLDMKTGEYKSSYEFDRFRVEINEMNIIQEYCKTNNISSLLNKYSSEYIKIMKKQDVFIDSSPVKSADFNDFNFRVTYKNEESIGKNSKIGQDLITNWDKSKKQFRYINRVSYIASGLPFRIDLSIVRSSTKDKRGQLLKTYNIAESNVFQNYETYEIEIEVITAEAKRQFKTPEELMAATEHIVKIVLFALQKTNYPIFM